MDNAKCQHSNIHGFCPDCGNPTYTVGDELYYKRFQDIYNVAGGIIIEEVMNIIQNKKPEEMLKGLHDFINKKQKQYSQIKEVYQDLNKTIEDLKRGKPIYK